MQLVTGGIGPASGNFPSVSCREGQGIVRGGKLSRPQSCPAGQRSALPRGELG